MTVTDFIYLQFSSGQLLESFSVLFYVLNKCSSSEKWPINGGESAIYFIKTVFKCCRRFWKMAKMYTVLIIPF